MPVIDCTLRDGGYYNNWDFDQDFVASYMQTMLQAGVDYVEIGFRGVKGGLYANVNDLFLGRLSLLRKPKLAVMINAKDALAYEYGADGFVLAHFVQAKSSRVSLVRVAAQFSEAVQCEKICLALKALGYDVALNLMQCADKDMDSLLVVKRVVDNWGCACALYLADSLGNMEPLDVSMKIDRLLEADGTPLGVHMHDNRGLALANTISAHDAGAMWLDSTVLGMGRGAGNVKTEYLLTELGRPYRCEPVFTLAESTEMVQLQKTCGWGQHQFYALSAKRGVHPTYVQELRALPGLSNKTVLAAIEKLSASGARFYDKKLLQAVLKEKT
jgi:4-hydroxy 2-oxovalerate aldolase